MTSASTASPTPVPSLDRAATEGGPTERRTRRGRPAGFWHVCRLPLLAGLVVRLVLVPWTSTTHDVQVWYVESVHGLFGVPLYARPGFTYPPVWALPLRAIGVVARSVGLSPGSLAVHSNVLNGLAGQLRSSGSPYVTTPGYNVAFKLVLVAFDLGAAWLVWRTALRLSSNHEVARRASMLWWLSPLVIFETAVHGAFDAVVAFFVLAAVLARIEGRFAVCGAALALGILTKVSPAFLLPLFAVTAVVPLPGERWRAEQGTQRWPAPVANLGRMVGAGALTGLVFVLPVIASGRFGSMLDQVTIRTGGAAGVGGVGLLGITNAKALSDVPDWAMRNGAIISHAGTAIDVTVAVLVALAWIRWRHRYGWSALVTGAALALLVPVLVQGRGQPQYLLWSLPLLALLSAPSWWPSAGLFGLGAGATAFELSVAGPLAFLTPLAVSTGAVSLTSVVHQTQYLIATPGWVGSSRGGDYELMSWAVITVSLIVTWAGIVYVLRRRAAGAPAVAAPGPEPGTAPATPRARRAAAVTGSAGAAVALTGAALVVVLLVSSAAGLGTSTKLTVSAPTRQGSATAVGVALPSSPAPVRVVGFGAVSNPRMPKLYVYQDHRYPSSGSNPHDQASLLADLRSDLRTRGDGSALHVVNADQLPGVLRDTGQAKGRTVVLATGTLPNTVWSHQLNLLTPWLQAGGRIVWAGAPPGLYSVGPAAAVVAVPAVIEPLPGHHLVTTTHFGCGPSPNAGHVKVVHPGRLSPGVELSSAGQNAALLGIPFTLPPAPPAGSGGCVGTVPTRLGAVLGIDYPSVGDAPTIADLRSIHGLALGYLAGSRTSVSWMPTGSAGGGTVLFAGRLQPDVVAADTCQVLQTGITRSVTPVAATTLTAGQSARLVFSPTPADAHSVVVAGFDASPDGTFFERDVRPAR